jgi:uncharacterized membrane protein
MPKIEKQIEVNAPLASVWSLLLWERIPEWFTPFKKVEYTSGEKNKVGETVRITTDNGEIEAATLETEENQKVAWRYSGRVFTGTEVFTLTQKSNEAVIVLDVLNYELNSALSDNNFDKFFHKALESTFDVCLPKLKALAEKNSD